MLASIYLGTGHHDIANAISFLGIPGGHSWHNKYFEKRDKINQDIIELCECIIEESLVNEIKAVMKDKLGDKYTSTQTEIYIDNFMNDSIDIPADVLNIGIIVSYDMGWQKRSTGRIYDSISGHGFMIGTMTGKVVAVGVKCKKCTRCTIANKNNTTVRTHNCPVNHIGSSGSMEASMALELITNMSEKSNAKVYIKGVVSDDDSTMRSLLQHKSNHGKGNLPENVQEPIFFADPSHRIKVMCKPFF